MAKFTAQEKINAVKCYLASTEGECSRSSTITKAVIPATIIGVIRPSRNRSPF